MAVDAPFRQIDLSSASAASPGGCRFCLSEMPSPRRMTAATATADRQRFKSDRTITATTTQPAPATNSGGTRSQRLRHADAVRRAEPPGDREQPRRPPTGLARCHRLRKTSRATRPARSSRATLPPDRASRQDRGWTHDSPRAPPLRESPRRTPEAPSRRPSRSQSPATTATARCTAAFRHSKPSPQVPDFKSSECWMMKNAAESIHTSAVKIANAPQIGKTSFDSRTRHSVTDGTANNPASAKPDPIHACPLGDCVKTAGRLQHAYPSPVPSPIQATPHQAGSIAARLTVATPSAHPVASATPSAPGMALANGASAELTAATPSAAPHHRRTRTPPCGEKSARDPGDRHGAERDFFLHQARTAGPQQFDEGKLREDQEIPIHRRHDDRRAHACSFRRLPSTTRPSG